ncbi:hypothetical protein PoB_002829000 [Plakobranchus ocellatus]|uniref:Uncharacterized protein n=1 Tax=Plakobranchus ocellatus TaxID=259542 RepID=A0AAV4A4J6_9GAST|nr:hypothetical protein PoB_002829000 [Plakobranchus ocellatus]
MVSMMIIGGNGGGDDEDDDDHEGDDDNDDDVEDVSMMIMIALTFRPSRVRPGRRCRLDSATIGIPVDFSGCE